MNGYTPDELRVEVAYRQLECIRAGQAARGTKRGTRLFAWGCGGGRGRPGGDENLPTGRGLRRSVTRGQQTRDEATPASAGPQPTAPEPIT